MTPVVAFPFPHTAWLLTAAGGTWASLRLLPEMRARWLIGAAAGIGLACVATVCGLIPWLGQLHLALYGLCLLGAFLLAYVLLSRRCELIGVSERTLQTLTLVAMAAGLAGARARYVWERPQEFTHDQLQHALPISAVIGKMADFDSGGMVWYGGLTAATIAVALVAWRKGIRLFPLADIIAPALLAGLAIGRIGCFLNGCCYGRACDLPWAVPHPLFASAGERQVMVHPTQLYETVVCSVVAAALWWYWRRRRVDGVVTCLGVIAYAIWRFVNEGLRGDDRIPSTWLGLPGPGAIDMSRTFSLPLDTSQITSLQLIAGALLAACAVAWYRRRHPDAALAARAVPGSIHARVPATEPAPQPAPGPTAAPAALPTRAH